MNRYHDYQNCSFGIFLAGAPRKMATILKNGGHLENRYSADLVPARFGFSIPANPQVQVVMLSARCEHLPDFLLHINSTIMKHYVIVEMHAWSDLKSVSDMLKLQIVIKMSVLPL